MNRFQNVLGLIEQLQRGSTAAASPAGAVLDAAPSGDTARALFAPLHYEPNYAYPLLVWLHGGQSDQRELSAIMPRVSVRNYVAVAPRGLARHGRYGWPQSPEEVEEAQQRIFEAIEAAQDRFCVAPQRIFLAGADGGGTMALRVAMNHPTRFAGVASLGGPFPRGQTPLGQWALARRLGVLLAVGRDSASYPPTEACEDLRLLHAAGISVTLRQYPCGEPLLHQALGDVNRWIMEQLFAPADAPAASEPSPRSVE